MPHGAKIAVLAAAVVVSAVSFAAADRNSTLSTRIAYRPASGQKNAERGSAEM